MIDYYELANLTDKILEIAEEDEGKLAKILDNLEPEIRQAILVSDWLNAYQTFYYFFREAPNELAKERLILNAASECETGVLIEEIDMLELVFAVRRGEPIVAVSDGNGVIARFTGSDAYHHAMNFIDENPD